MGQQSSKAQSPLTFGYVNHSQNDDTEFTLEEYLGQDRSTPDFVLDNPHLYRLEFACGHSRSTTISEVNTGDELENMTQQTNSVCKLCKQNNRLSLVQRDLASDLNYIDETYYPDIIHYVSDEDDEDDELDQMNSAISYYGGDDDTDTLRDEEGWSRLTYGEVRPKRLVSSPSLAVDLSGKSLIKLSSSIGYLQNITKLDLSDNQMINLPRAIGQLKNLRILNASKNQLEFIPDTIIQLTKIKSIDLSDNKLKHLSRWIGKLPSLLVLDLNSNQLAKLPREIANLLDLVTLDISHNPLKSIPAEISTLKSLRKLLAEGCEFESECTDELKHDPPSLFEICARNVVKSNIPLPVGITKNITDYLKTCQKCTFCHGPFFDSYVGRSRIIERTARQLIVLDYKLCSAHWTDENDRMTAMFSTSYYTTPSINSSPSDKNIPHPDAQENNTNFADSNSSLFHQDESIISQQFSQESLVSSPAQSPCSEQEDPIHNLLSERPDISTASSSSPAFINRPRALSTGTSMKKYNQHIEASSTHNQEESTSQHHILPFAQLRGRQSEEADRIMSIQRPASTRKTNGFIQSFEKLGAKLSRKPVNGRDRSGTL